MEFKRKITTENGITVEVVVNCTVSKMSEDQKCKLLHRFAECSSSIYLELAEEINKVNNIP